MAATSSRLKKSSKNRRLIAGVVEQARKDPFVLAAILFGSLARNEGTSKSDVDICLVIHPNHLSKKALVSRRFDYLGFGADIHFFQLLPLYVQVRILKEGKVLFVRDEDLLYEIALRAVRRFEDFKPIYNMYLEETARA